MGNADDEAVALREELESFCKTKLTSPVDQVQLFRISGSWPKLTLWSNDETRRRLAAKIFDNLRQVVISARFYYENQLVIVIDDDNVQVDYKDDVFDFSVRVTSDGMSLTKPGTDMKTFATWVYQMRDSIESIFQTALTAVNDFYGDRQLRFTTVRYEMKFMLSDFVECETAKSTNHAVLMTRLIKKYPDREGQLEDENGSNLDNVARVDYGVHQWLGAGERARSVFFGVEAPANRNRSTLWFTFAYSGMSYTSPNGERWKCNPAELLNEAGPFLDFIKTRALGSFMKSLLDGYSFQTGT